MTNLQLDVFTRGTCSYMCPEKERNMRQREKLLHPFEILEGTEHFALPLADPMKCVKAFSRSAAGRRSPSPSNLRPLRVLEETVSYLFKRLKFDRSKDWITEYDFIFDRMRAVNQDAIIQGLNSKESIHLFESFARFLVYSGYRLSLAPRSKYDPIINSKHLQECLKKILFLYDHNSEYSSNMEKRSQLEALYIVHNMGDVTALHRGVSLKKLWRTKDVEMALAMSFAVWNGHYIQALKLLKVLPLILACAAALHVPNIRRKAFQVMSYAYSSKSVCYPVRDLQHLLLYSSDKQLIDDCKHYNILHQNGGIQFLKGSFNGAADHIAPRPCDSLERMLSCCNLTQILLTGKEG